MRVQLAKDLYFGPDDIFTRAIDIQPFNRIYLEMSIDYETGGATIIATPQYSNDGQSWTDDTAALNNFSETAPFFDSKDFDGPTGAQLGAYRLMRLKIGATGGGSRHILNFWVKPYTIDS